MKIYNIVKGQLITIWVFGLVATFISFVIAMNLDNFSGWLIVFVFIPCLLIFYTIGWKAYKKQLINNKENITETKNPQDLV